MQSKLNVLSGENVQYTYDSLNKLAASVTTQTPTPQAPAWGNSYAFDGYGNLTDINVTLGSAPSYHTTFNQATNRENGQTYDANGNDTGPNYNPSPRQYDVDNRLVVTHYGLEVIYGYAPDNKRIFKNEQWTGDTSPIETKLYFHGLGGERLGEYRFNFTNSGQTFSIDLVSGNTWFGGKLLREGDWAVVQDSKGSVRWRKNVVTSATETADYFPFGQEKPSATAQNRQKFGTYLRDAETGLDYADQRYFTNTSGRFVTPDPAGDGRNWYAYAGGDPVNSSDPTGLNACALLGLIHIPATDSCESPDIVCPSTLFPTQNHPNCPAPNSGLSDRCMAAMSLQPNDPIFQECFGTPPPPPPTPEVDPQCFVQLRYRGVPASGNVANHAFWIVGDRNDSTWTISGVRDLGVFLSFGDRLRVVMNRGYGNGADSSGAAITFTVYGDQYCDAVDSMKDAAGSFGSYWYGELGPNSNTAARVIGEAGGFYPGAPPAAVGWDASLSGRSKRAFEVDPLLSSVTSVPRMGGAAFK